MATIRTTLRGLNTELLPHRCPSGTADRAVNVTLKGGQLQRRKGFSVLENDVRDSGDENPVLNMGVVHFESGDVHIVCKMNDGAEVDAAAELWAREVYDTDALDFAVILTEQEHNADDRGWFFTWADRLHYFDRAGGTRWHPDNLSDNDKAFKAGLPRPWVGLVLTAASGGEKDGRYHVVASYENSVTDEIGIIDTPQGGGSYPLACSIESHTGGIIVLNWRDGLGGYNDPDDTIRDHTNAAKYEWDQIQFWCSRGDTEWIGQADGVECFSYRFYRDNVALKATEAQPGLNKADDVHDPQEYNRNNGGEPPGSQFGAWNGVQAIYGGVWRSAAKVACTINYSLPRFPTMVPARYTYTVTGIDAKTVIPKPWEGKLTTGVPGVTNDIAAGGGVTVLFTPTSTHALDRDADGRIWVREVHPSIGCVSQGASVGSPWGVFALGYRSLLKVTPTGVRDLAIHRLGPTLEAIPTAYRSLCRVAAYGYENEIWVAVPKPGGTKAQRIIVYDVTEDNFVFFELACLGTRATYSTDHAGDNNDVTITAEAPGVAGNDLTLTVAVGGTAGKEAVSISGDDVTVTIEAEVTTCQQFMDAFNECADVVAVATCELKAGNDGTGTLPGAIEKVNLSGGDDDEGITAMCELALPDADPVMLVATDLGRILKYPDGDKDGVNEREGEVDEGYGYAARWRGYFGQERLAVTKKLQRVFTHCGASVEDAVRLAVRAMGTANESVSQVSKTLQKSSLVDASLVEFDLPPRNLFQLEFYSPQTVETQWTISDLVLRMEPQKPK